MYTTMVKSRRAADQKRAVFEGRLAKTDSGLTKADLVVSASGQIVSRKKHEIGKARWKPSGLWPCGRSPSRRVCAQEGCAQEVEAAGEALFYFLLPALSRFAPKHKANRFAGVGDRVPALQAEAPTELARCPS
jgi:hypothetical protein